MSRINYAKSTNYQLFTLVIFLLFVFNGQGLSQLTFDQAFSPATIGPGSTTKLTFTITNTAQSTVTDISFTNTLPTELMLADPSNAVTDCSDGVLSAPNGGSTISLTDARLGTLESCTVEVFVTGDTPSPTPYTNTTSDLTSSAGTTDPSSADLTGIPNPFRPLTIPFPIFIYNK